MFNYDYTVQVQLRNHQLTTLLSLWTVPAPALTGSLWDWSTVIAGDSGPAPFWLSLPPISYPVFHLSSLHDPDRQKQLASPMFDLGQGLLKTNTYKPRNMVICSGWVKECGFINNRANQTHIKLRFRFSIFFFLFSFFFFPGSETRGTQWGEVNVGLFNKGLVVIPKGDQGNL